MRNNHILILVILFISISIVSEAQVHSTIAYEYFINPLKKKDYIEMLTSPQAAGRASGTEGGEFVRDYIEQEFEKIGLRKFRGEYIQSFPVNIPKSSKGEAVNLTGHNVVGYLPSQTSNKDYIVIGAHYDHMGTLHGNLYPGADDNASGVAILLELAEIFSNISQAGTLNKNIVFVAFDANNHNNAGSKYFVSEFGHPINKISSMINLDQIGSTMSPPNNNKEYLLVLGLDKLDKWSQDQLFFFNQNTESPLNMDIDTTYYGSESFYKIFYALSDQSSFTAKNIPSILFTSGITHVTNREGDNVSVIDFPVLDKRSKLIYRFVYQLLSK